MKYIVHIVAVLVIAFGWIHHLQNKSVVKAANELIIEMGSDNRTSDDIPNMLKDAKGKRADVLKQFQEMLGDKQTDTDETISMAKEMTANIDNGSTFMGIFMAFLTAGYSGFLFVVYILPSLAQRATHSVFDSGEELEKDPMAEARSLAAQGDYDGAIAAYREAAEKQPENRMPWVEIVKIQREILEQPQAAIDSIREALEKQAWPEADTTFFLFRLVDLYDNDNQDRDSAAAILRQVMEQFPETRYSANARTKLQEWGMA